MVTVSLLCWVVKVIEFVLGLWPLLLIGVVGQWLWERYVVEPSQPVWTPHYAPASNLGLPPAVHPMLAQPEGRAHLDWMDLPTEPTEPYAESPDFHEECPYISEEVYREYHDFSLWEWSCKDLDQ